MAIDPVTKKLVSKIFDKLKQNLWF